MVVVNMTLLLSKQEQSEKSPFSFGSRPHTAKTAHTLPKVILSSEQIKFSRERMINSNEQTKFSREEPVLLWFPPTHCQNRPHTAKSHTFERADKVFARAYDKFERADQVFAREYVRLCARSC